MKDLQQKVMLIGKWCSLLIVIISLPLMANGQHIERDVEVYVPDSDLLLPGYMNRVNGTKFTYGTAIPGVENAMIVRATDGNWYMEWETAKVPANVSQDYISFVWAANLDSRTDDIPMTLTVNGTTEIGFNLSSGGVWSSEMDGLTLSFQKSMTDEHGDFYGFMILRVPSEKLDPGHPVMLRVTAGNTNTSAWYMTVTEPVRESLRVTPNDAILTIDGQSVQPLSVQTVQFGKPGSASFLLGNDDVVEYDQQFGLNEFVVHHPVTDQMRTMAASVTAGEKILETEVQVRPVRKWNMHMVQNTHTDIGYTRPQTEIMSELIRHIDLALDYLDQTDHLPEDAQFRWTAENTWAVNQFLQNRTKEQIERLKQRVHEGRIELTGMYLNFDEVPDEQILARSLKPVERIREHGMEVTTAMQNDVNGIGWSMNDYFSSLGIRYLTMGTHAHKALLVFDHPMPFWWESPSGNKMLAFRGEHYHTGNLRFHISRGDFSYFEKELLSYLNELGDTGYPLDTMMIQHSGYLTDNSPPSVNPSEMIEKWNEKYEWPKLRFSVARDFFEEIEAKHGEELPVYRAAWPDWWVDGFGSGAREVAAMRQAMSDIRAGQGAQSMALMGGYDVGQHSLQQSDLTNEALLFYGEHTMGSHESVSKPDGKETLEMRRLKESFAWEATRRAKMVQEEAVGLLLDDIQNADVPSLVVYNSAPHRRSGSTTLFIDHETIPAGKTIKLVDSNGNQSEGQLIRHAHRGDYWTFWLSDMLPMGYRQYRLEADQDYEIQTSRRAEGSIMYENDWYRFKVDVDKAALTSLYDKELELELRDQESEYSFAEFIHEELGNRVELDQYYLESYSRSGLKNTVCFDAVAGPVFDAIRCTGDTLTANGEQGFELIIKPYHTEKRIDFTFTINKKLISDPESIYIAFPFTLPNGEIHFDVAGGMARAGIDQLPGSSNDWNMVQNAAIVRNSDSQIVLGVHEAPLMQFGAINTGRFESGAVPVSTHVFGWPMNNYWVTNFNADQRGEFEWTYSLTSQQSIRNSHALMQPSTDRLPFITRLRPASNSGNPMVSEGAMMDAIPENVKLVTASPHAERESVLLHFRELDGVETAFQVQLTGSNTTTLYRTDVNGNRLGDAPVKQIKLKPFEAVFYEADLSEEYYD
jgi:hypothetical protein